jgi:hypothetical protein
MLDTRAKGLIDIPRPLQYVSDCPQITFEIPIHSIGLDQFPSTQGRDLTDYSPMF